ncbi:hypothetical protein Poli38472_009380 [Pythium oligandrum]|uniref:Uncharacterized protein n=1 Tax=Pythium oligandrum TaxID=41045 RepID=A0A8K1CMV5_PYTOL|nr:hypothetical protein Poli38472_009380 [Pythium oligandrum]|eukprot:TMW65213.1 hypothetical protein Poli38472_009380 [Pythium oligandrum]
MPVSTQKLGKLGSASSDVGDTALDELIVAWKSGTCSYYPADHTNDTCLKPRSCYDCLNKFVESEGEWCMIDDAGKCVSSKNDYDVRLDYRQIKVVNNRSVEEGPAVFRGGETIYCDYDEPQCEYCRSQGLFGEVYGVDTSDERATFCIGTNGCVCIAACESDTYDDDVGGAKCLSDLVEKKITDKLQNSTSGLQNSTNGFQNSTNELQGDTSHKGKGPWMVVSVVLGIAVLLLVAAVVIYRRRAKSSSSANTTSLATTAPASSTPPRPTRSLNLFGWRAKRQHLIDKEQAVMGDPDALAHSASYVELADVAPSAPDADFVPVAYVASAPDVDLALEAIPLARSFNDESTSDRDTNTEKNKLD